MFRKITACAAALTLAFVPSVTVHAEGNTVKVSINGQEKSLALNDTTGTENEKDILGDAWYYGVVADTFSFNGEAETNFAVKSLKHTQGAGGQTGVTDKGEGSKKAFFMAGSVDSPFMIKGIDAEVVTPDSEKEKFQKATNSSNPITFTETDADDINAYIDALENDVTVQSQRLSELDSITDYTDLDGQGKISLNVTDAGNNTVYINVDKWQELKNQLTQSGGVSLIKNAGQKVVFNFPADTEVTLQKMTVTTGEKTEDTAALANHSTASDGTAADLIFNMPVATTVTLNDSTGIFLAPKASVTSHGVDGGWLVADTFTNNCEWHFINGGLPEEITERKTMITPKEEGSVLGARRPGPAVSPKTEEKSVETPQPEEKEEKPVETTSDTPVTEKTDSNPQPTPEVTAVPTPATTPVTATSQPVEEKAETKSVKSTPAPSSAPKTTEKTVSSPKPVETKKTEKNESSGRSITKKESGTTEKKPAETHVTAKKYGSVRPVESARYAAEVREAAPVKDKAVGYETPNTADHSDMNIYSALLIGAGILMIGVIRRMRKEEE